MCLVEGQVGGVTHILFSPDGNRLYSGGRKVTSCLQRSIFSSQSAAHITEIAIQLFLDKLFSHIVEQIVGLYFPHHAINQKFPRRLEKENIFAT